MLDGVAAKKPAQMVSDDMTLSLDDPASGYVSRAALKLISALDAFGFEPKGKTCVDIGASTGGFCQVLLERGATEVYGVDVGHDQMHESLRANPSLHVLEGVNARHLDETHIPVPFQGLVSDVSFISLKLALPPALAMAEAGAFASLLVKPQFEVGKDGIGKGGLVRDENLAEQTARDIRDWLDQGDGPCAGWRCLDLIPSPILGGDGNKEYLLGAVKDR
jgi:23S rRNA (cytidine1920-2'-O)/16S rRNA (cytidine1409-2'-O)-methyltransferase